MSSYIYGTNSEYCDRRVASASRRLFSSHFDAMVMQNLTITKAFPNLIPPESDGFQMRPLGILGLGKLKEVTDLYKACFKFDCVARNKAR